MADHGTTMTERRCVKCGETVAETANFCAECGASTAVPSASALPASQPSASALPASPPSASLPSASALPASLPSASALPASPPSASPLPGEAPAPPFLPVPPPSVPSPVPSLPSPPLPPMTGVAPSVAKTLIHFGGAESPPAPAGAVGTRQNPAPNRTMIGIVGPATAAEPPPSPANQGTPAMRQTVLGVAVPGIAPLRAGEVAPGVVRAERVEGATIGFAQSPPAPRAVPIVPLPEPLTDIPVPIPPRIPRKRGVPLTAVALATGVLVLVGGLALAWFWRGAPPITAQARSAPDGKDVISLHCDPRSCKDGTTVEVGDAKGSFVGGEAELVLAEALHVGANRLALRIDRPGMGRNEVLSLSVPVAYRVRADLTAMNGPRSLIVIHVEAAPGSDVTLDGNTLTLDARGSGDYAVDESAATEGPADESHVISLDVGYRVAVSGQEVGRGTVSARVAVAPLRVDVPGAHAVVSSDQIVLAGRAARGATVSVDGKPVDLSPEGLFETNIVLDALGERTVEVRTATATLVTRTVHVVMKRVAHLTSEAKDFERQPLVGYDSAVKDFIGTVGRAMVVDGEVIESRTVGHRTVALVDDRRGCAKGPCLARVVVRQDITIAPGKVLRAYGRLTHPYTTSPGQTVPEVDADFVIPSRR
jgi:RNase P/RNase MRP subunit p29